MQNIILIAISFIFVPAISFAKVCSNPTTLDQFSTFTIQLKEDLTNVEGSTWDDDGESTIYFSDKTYVNSMFARFTRLTVEREISVVFRNEHIVDKTVKKFQCTSQDIFPASIASFIYFDYNCPVARIGMLRQAFDFRSATYTLGSLAYNLGKRFAISAECE
jgi:hypothetical protein